MTYLVIAFFFGLAGGVIGRVKGSSFLLWFVISAAVPFVGLLADVVYRVEADEPQRACHGCGNVVPLYQAMCTRSGPELVLDDTAEVLPPASAAATER